MTLLELTALDNALYIGDGVYVGSDGMHVWLCTSNGLAVTNAVALDAEVLKSFRQWLQRHVDA